MINSSKCWRAAATATCCTGTSSQVLSHASQLCPVLIFWSVNRLTNSSVVISRIKQRVVIRCLFLRCFAEYSLIKRCTQHIHRSRCRCWSRGCAAGCGVRRRHRNVGDACGTSCGRRTVHRAVRPVNDHSRVDLRGWCWCTLLTRHTRQSTPVCIQRGTNSGTNSFVVIASVQERVVICRFFLWRLAENRSVKAATQLFNRAASLIVHHRTTLVHALGVLVIDHFIFHGERRRALHKFVKALHRTIIAKLSSNDFFLLCGEVFHTVLGLSIASCRYLTNCGLSRNRAMMPPVRQYT